MYVIQCRSTVMGETNWCKSWKSDIPDQMRCFSIRYDKAVVGYGVTRAIYVISACVDFQ